MSLIRQMPGQRNPVGAYGFDGTNLIVCLHKHVVSGVVRRHDALLRNSFDVESWHFQQLRFALLSDADPSGLDNLARLLKEVNQ